MLPSRLFSLTVIAFGATVVAATSSRASHWAGSEAPAPLDIVIAGGRVIDPESGLDGIRSVGIANGRIMSIESGRPPAGRDTIDAHGLVVSPGFIDLHSHGQD